MFILSCNIKGPNISPLICGKRLEYRLSKNPLHIQKKPDPWSAKKQPVHIECLISNCSYGLSYFCGLCCRSKTASLNASRWNDKSSGVGLVVVFVFHRIEGLVLIFVYSIFDALKRLFLSRYGLSGIPYQWKYNKIKIKLNSPYDIGSLMLMSTLSICAICG